MKYSVIDIGSNSVRLLLWADGRSICKKVMTTRLGEGLAQSGVLSDAAVRRTVRAVEEFSAFAKSEGAECSYAFATAAVRRAENGKELLALVKVICGLEVRVLSGEEEAFVGLLGATDGKDGGVVDVGGASTEITVGKKGDVVYSFSADVGAVRLKDVCGEDVAALQTYAQEQVCVFENVPACELYAIGGTATSLCALEYAIEPYDAKLVHGKVLTEECIENWAHKLLQMPQTERLSLVGMDKPRADILGGAALWLAAVLRRIGAKSVVVSEQDNLEGFILAKQRGLL